MNSKARSSLETCSGSPVLELETIGYEYDDLGTVTVVIKHDYYSSDNNHGRILLNSFLNALKDNHGKKYRLIIMDTGVRLLAKSSSGHGLLEVLIRSASECLVCSDSCFACGIDIDDSLSGLLTVSADEIALEIINAANVLYIE